MQSAISLYFDGPIQAQHCNYLSYRDFGLLCPECGSPVFLASGDIQTPHFRHFKAKDNESSYCKYRVSSPQLLPRQTGGFDHHKQREKSFRQHFWKLLNATLPHLGLKEIQQEIETAWLDWDLHSAWIKGWQLAANKGKLKPLIDDYMQAMFSGILESAETGDSAQLLDYCSSLNQEVQQRTMYAIADFLALKQSQEFLKILFYYGFFDYVHKFSAPPLHQVHRIYPWILADILGILCVVPWAEAAQAMQKNGHFSLRQEIRVRPGLLTPVVPESYQLWSSSHSAKFKPAGFGLISSTRKSHG